MGRPEVSTSPISPIVTDEQAWVSPYVGATGQPASFARSRSVRSAGAPPSSTARSVAGLRSTRASWVGTIEASVTSSRSGGPMTAVVA